jgi:hypothetical protein
VPIGFDNISREFLCCSKCKKELNAIQGEYVAKHPSRSFIGFHISQAMMSGVQGTGVPWSRLYEKVENPLYGIGKLYNECLGFSYDSGSKLLTESDLRKCYDPETDNFSTDRKSSWGIQVVCAGVDWGVLGGNTHTVVTIGGIDKDSRTRVMYSKKFPIDQNPVDQVEEVASIINRSGASVVAADRGGGVYANAFLRKSLAWASLHEIEYKAKVNAGMQYHKDAKSWMTDRTRAMAGVIIDIKNERIVFPRGEAMKDFAPDLLTLSCEYNERIRAFQIIRDINTPDDFAHTLVYLRIAAKCIAPNPRATTHELEEFVPPPGAVIDDKEAPI